MTQDAIESLHSVIWGQNSKSMLDSLLAMERAVAEAVSRFNQGMTKTSMVVAEQLCYVTGSCPTRRSPKKDKQKLGQAGETRMESEKVNQKMAKRHISPTGPRTTAQDTGEPTLAAKKTQM